MSTYKPGRLYLVDLDGETYEAQYVIDGTRPLSFQLRDGRWTYPEHVENVREAIVLDPENDSVKSFARFWGTPKNGGVGSQYEVARAIAGQIAPPKPPMGMPTEWGTKITDDRGNWVLTVARMVESDFLCWCSDDGEDWSSWDEMQNPQPYKEN